MATTVERRDTVRPADVYRSAPPQILGRRNDRRQLASTMTVMVKGAGAGTAVLEGAGLKRTQPLRSGRGTFLGLAPGLYELTLDMEGLSQPVTRWLTVRRQTRATLYVPLQGGARSAAASP